MIVKIVLVLGFLVCIIQAIKLTKENNLAENAQLQNYLLEDSAVALGNPEVRQQVLDEIFSSPKTAIFKVAELLQKKTKPEVSDVLAEFNDGLGYKLLVIDGEYVVLDPVVFEKLLSQKAKSISRALYPYDYYQQLSMFGTLQKKILELSPAMISAIQLGKVPVSSFTTLLTVQSVTKSDITAVESKDLLEDVISAVEVSICNVVVASIYDQVNATLQSSLTYLSSITIASSDDIWGALISAGLNIVIELGETLINYVNSLASSYASTICEDIFSSDSDDSDSRKRRDLSAAEETQQALLSNKNIITDVLDLLWDLLAPVLNYIAKLIVNVIADGVLAQLSAVISLAKAALELVIDNILS